MRRHLLSVLILATAVVAGCGMPANDQTSADPSTAASLPDSFPDTAIPTTTVAKTRPLPAGCSVVTADDLKAELGLSGFDQDQDAEPDSDGMASVDCTYSYTKALPHIMFIGLDITAFDVTVQPGDSLHTQVVDALPCTAPRAPATGVWDDGTQCTDGIAVGSKLGGDDRILSITVTDPDDESGIQWTAKLRDLAVLTFPRLLS